MEHFQKKEELKKKLRKELEAMDVEGVIYKSNFVTPNQKFKITRGSSGFYLLEFNIYNSTLENDDWRLLTRKEAIEKIKETGGRFSSKHPETVVDKYFIEKFYSSVDDVLEKLGFKDS